MRAARRLKRTRSSSASARLHRADLDGIFDYPVRKWGVDQALCYTQELENLCTVLAQAPTLASDCGHIRPGYRRGVAGRHVIYFRVEH